MSHGGARPGAGRPPRLSGDLRREELLAAVEHLTPPATLAALFDDARAGDFRALRMLIAVFDRAEQHALRERADPVGRADKISEKTIRARIKHSASTCLSVSGSRASDLFAGEGCALLESAERQS